MQIYRLLYISLFLFVLNYPILKAQDDNQPISEYELELKELFDSLFFRNEIRFLRNDSEKIALNEEIIEKFNEVLLKKESFTYPFQLIKNCGITLSPDNEFKIYNWNLRFSDGSYKYYGFIQNKHKDKKENEEILTWQLNDKSDSIQLPEMAMLTHNLWWGCLYYDILPFNEGDKKYYILLGWDGNDHFTNKKIIDVLYFTSKGDPRFGKAFFKYNKKSQKRFFIEHALKVSVVLRYDPAVGAIVWDHLAPDHSSKKGDFSYYGPDGSYDGFKWNGDKWIYIPEIYVTNPKPTKKPKKEN